MGTVIRPVTFYCRQFYYFMQLSLGGCRVDCGVSESLKSVSDRLKGRVEAAICSATQYITSVKLFCFEDNKTKTLRRHRELYL